MRRTHRTLVAIALATAAITGAAVTGPAVAATHSHIAKPGHKPRPTPTPTPSSPGTLPLPDHVVVAVFENKDYTAIAASPTFAAWAKEGTLLTDSHGVPHPSQPNYIALWSGSTTGYTDNTCKD